jgi:hypothetical protein
MFQKTSSLNLPLTLPAFLSTSVFISLSLLSFLVPFLLGHPQWLVGTTVNACLFLAAIFLPRKFILPLIVFPSFGVLFCGMIFGPFTVFLAYFLPFLWLANLALIIVFKNLFPRLNYLSSVFLSAAVKSLLLFMIANVYFNFSIVPQAFLQLMGISQFFTALAGGAISWIIFNFYAKRDSGNKRTA